MRELDALVRDGIPRAALDSFLKLLERSDAVPPKLLRQKIVPRATYQRALTLNTQVSETTERLARLYALALSVFENPNAVVSFLMSPHPELGNQAPFDVALTEIGGREVEEVIERGLHGLPA
jgi:putative toxin-antitoxin system antitoxin component (TIGR02293 family)